MNTLIRTALATVLATIAFGTAEARSIRMEVNGLVCAFCANGITEALKKETDAASKDRLKKLEKEVAALEEQSAAMAAVLEVAVLGNSQPIASVPGEIVPAGDFYDYEDKYVNNAAQLLIPAPLDTHLSDEVRNAAIKIFQALRCDGLARVDFFYEEHGRGFLCNEVNTIPGFTPISMYPKLWEKSGVSYSALIDQLVDFACERHARRRRHTER